MITVIDAMNGMGQDWECSEVLRAEVRRLRGLLAAAEQRAATTEAALATLLEHLPSDEVLSESWQGDMYWEDIFALAEIVPIYRAVLTAPATQPDERAAAEREVINAAVADRRHFNECDACQDETCQIGAEYTCRLAEACDALLALDATDGAAKETT